MNKKLLTQIIAVLCMFTISDAQQSPNSYFESNYGLLEYGFYIPEDYDDSKKYPLVMYLHGKGNNHYVYLDWYSSEVQAENPCFVFTPRTPISWADWSGWWDQLTEPMIAALHVMDSLISVYPVDTSRLYVYGISMGGEGTFDLLHKYPGKFAAAMSVCGGGQPFWADNISRTPFWMFHGSADNINPPKLTEQVYDELVKIGAKKMRYKKYPGYGHEIWNVAASEPSWHTWMFSHSLEDTAFSKPTIQIKLTGSVINNDKIQLSWNDIRNPDERENKVWYYKIYNKDGIIGTVEFDNTMIDLPINNPVDTFKVSAVNYHFVESDLSNMVYYNNGFITRIDDVLSEQKLIYRLYQNYPNPFNPNTKIRYSIPHLSLVTLKVYDIFGKEVFLLANEVKNKGNYEIEFDGSNLSSGVYFYRMQAGGFNFIKKFIFMK